jgi:hypothetical protein
MFTASQIAFVLSAAMTRAARTDQLHDLAINDRPAICSAAVRDSAGSPGIAKTAR